MTKTCTVGSPPTVENTELFPRLMSCQKNPATADAAQPGAYGRGAAGTRALARLVRRRCVWRVPRGAALWKLNRGVKPGGAGECGRVRNVRNCPIGENALSVKRWPRRAMRISERGGSDTRAGRSVTF
jgi:hypothetical protein